MATDRGMPEVNLVVECGDDTRRVSISETPFLIGRERACQLRPRSAFVSRRHAEITRDAGDLILRDLDSSNGTYLNGNRVFVPTPLEAGDRIQIGPIEIKVAFGPASSKPAAQGDTSEDMVASWLMPEEDGQEQSRSHGDARARSYRVDINKSAAGARGADRSAGARSGSKRMA